MAMLQSLFKHIEKNEGKYIDRLKEAVAIPSISADMKHRPDVVKMGEWLAARLQTLGATDIKLRDIGQPLPPVVLAKFNSKNAKRTVLVYGHYDVQPALLSDGWNSNPFTLTRRGDVLFGRGSSDDKGPVVGWLNALEAYRETGTELPVNVVVCFEGMEESGSEGLDAMITAEARPGGYFEGVDCVCISDNYWLGTEQPVLTYGLRGVSYYEIAVEGPAADLHSGLFGGIVYEPMIDLVHLLATLVKPNGEILIPGVDGLVRKLTERERELYKNIHFTLGELEQNVGSATLIQDNVESALMHRWRYPSLSVHGVEGAFSEPGAKTVIPRKVVGKFSIRTVPDIDARKLDELVFAHVRSEFSKLQSKNKMDVHLVHDGGWWLGDVHNDVFGAAAKATKAVWGVDPDYTREGGSIPVAVSFEQSLRVPVVLLPLGRGDDGAHSTNEKMDVSNYVQGAKTLAAFLHFLA